MNLEQIIINNPWIIVLVVLWTLPWKGLALWKAAKNSNKKWFIALLILNTLAILEILYIFVFLLSPNFVFTSASSVVIISKIFDGFFRIATNSSMNFLIS